MHDDRDWGRQTASEGRFGYASRHLMIGLDPARESHPDFAHLHGHAAQVQVRTVLQHAWAEFEHDIRYKGTVPAEHVGDFDRRFTLAAGLLELADREFSEIRERLRGATPEVSETTGDDDPRLDPRELAAYLAGQYSEAGWSRTDHYSWIAGLLLELGVTSLAELGDVLRAADEAAIAARMAYRHPPGAVRRLDDALLWVFGERYVALHQNAHRARLLEHRLERLTGEPSGESRPYDQFKGGSRDQLGHAGRSRAAGVPRSKRRRRSRPCGVRGLRGGPGRRHPRLPLPPAPGQGLAECRIVAGLHEQHQRCGHRSVHRGEVLEQCAERADQFIRVVGENAVLTDGSSRSRMPSATPDSKAWWLRK